MLDNEVLVMSNTKSSQYTKPIIKDGYVSDPKLPAKFSINSEYFAEWLENNDKFKYIPSQSKAKSFTCYKDNKGYWSAQKRIQGKLRAKRLGNSDQLGQFTVMSFWDVAILLSSEYQTKDDEIETLKKEVRELSSKVAEMTDKLQDMKDKQEQDRQSLTQSNLTSEDIENIQDILSNALHLKANAGGKIKKEIRKVLEVMQKSSK